MMRVVIYFEILLLTSIFALLLLLHDGVVYAGTYNINCGGFAVPLLQSEADFLKRLYESTNGPAWCYQDFQPSPNPTYSPTASPTLTSYPTEQPTKIPTTAPSVSAKPSPLPTARPTPTPTTPFPSNTINPTAAPTSFAPSFQPTSSYQPTISSKPTYMPTMPAQGGSYKWDFSDSSSNPCFFVGVTCTCFLAAEGGVSPSFSYINSLLLPNNCLSGTLPSFAGLNSSFFRISFDLSKNSLVGTIPSSISNLKVNQLILNNNKLSGRIDSINMKTYLATLDLSYNRLSGPLSGYVMSFSNLVTLNLKSNYFTHTIPSALTDLTNLIVLDLSINKLSGTIYSNLFSMQNLQSISLQENYLWGYMNAFLCHPTPAIVSLNLSFNYFTGNLCPQIDAVFASRSLSTFDVSFNSLDGTLPKSISALKLGDFRACGNFLTGTIPNFSDGIGAIYMAYNSLIGSLPSAIPETLSRLQLQSNFLSGRIPSIPFVLTQIDLSDNRLTGGLPELLTSKDADQFLNNFNLSNNFLTGTIPESFYSSASNLYVLDLSNNSFVGTLSSSIQKLFTLDVLYLTGNRFSSTLPDSISALVNMQYMYLARNYFEGSLPSGLQLMTDLRCLWLYENAFEGNPFLSLDFSSQLKLQILDIGSNTFTGTLPSDFSQLKLLKAFVSESNCFSDTSIQESFCDIPTLKMLSLDGFKNNRACSYIKEKRRELMKYLPFVKGYISYNDFMSMPDCIMQMTSLVTLHLSGNYILGRLPSIPPNSSLSDLSLADNYFHGDIPKSIQMHEFSGQLNLGYNWLTGTLSPEFTVTSSQYLLALNNNRLSGDLPVSISSLNSKYDLEYVTILDQSGATDDYNSNSNNNTNSIRVLDVLDGNMFACPDGMPALDVSSDTYTCGSADLDRALGIYAILWAPIVLLVVALSALSKRLSQKRPPPSLHAEAGADVYLSACSSSSSSSSYSNNSYNKKEDIPPPSSSSPSSESSSNNNTNNTNNNNCSSLCSSYYAYMMRYVDMCHLYLNDFIRKLVDEFDYSTSEISKWNKKALDAIVFLQASSANVSLDNNTNLFNNKGDIMNTNAEDSAKGEENDTTATANATNTSSSRPVSVIKGTVGDIPEIRCFLTSLMFVRKWALGAMLYLVVVFIPLYAILSSSGLLIMTHVYTYVVSVTYLHGVPTFIAVSVFLLIILVGTYLLVLCNHRLLYRFMVLSSLSKYEFIDNLSRNKSRVTVAREYFVIALVCIANAAVTISVNSYYIDVVLYKGRYIVLAQIFIGLFQLLWEKYFVGYFSNDGLSELVKLIFRLDESSRVSEPLVMRINFQMNVFNSILVPVLASVFTNRNCLYYAFKEHYQISSSLQFNICKSFDQDPITHEVIGCLEEQSQFSESFYVPPFAYSYSCGASVLQSYVPVFIFSYCLSGIIIPTITLLRLLYPNLLDSFGRRTKASIESFLGWITCVRSSKMERSRSSSRSRSRSKSVMVVGNPLIKQGGDIENDNVMRGSGGGIKPATSTTNSRSQTVNANNVDNGTHEDSKSSDNNDLVVEEILGKEQIGKLMIALCTFFTFGIANPLLGIIACIFLISITSLDALVVARNLCLISKFITDLSSKEGGCKSSEGLTGGVLNPVDPTAATATASATSEPSTLTDSTLNASPDANYRTLSSSSSSTAPSSAPVPVPDADDETSSGTELRYIHNLEKQLLYSWKGVKSCFKEMIFVIMLFWSLLFFDIIVDSSECSGFSRCTTFEVAILVFISLVIVLMLAISFLMRYQKAYYFDKLSKKIMVSVFKLKYPDNNGTSGNRDSQNDDNGDGRKNSKIELRTLSISSSSMLPYNSDAGYFVHGRDNSISLEDYHEGSAGIMGGGGAKRPPSSSSLYPRSRVTSASSLSLAGSRATRSPSVTSASSPASASSSPSLSSSLPSSSSSLPDTNVSSYLNRTISVAMD